MIDDLDKTLNVILQHELSTEITQQVTISFDRPDDKFPPQAVSLPAIDLFLYEVGENRELSKRMENQPRPHVGSTIKYHQSARVDCSYLITAWPSESLINPIENEHRLLSEVMKALLRYPTLPKEMLQGSLQGHEPPLSNLVFQTELKQNLGEFWLALGIMPKVSLNYTVTIEI